MKGPNGPRRRHIETREVSAVRASVPRGSHGASVPTAVPPPAVAAASRQRSFDDLGTPLIDVTFCVLDVETTGTSPEDDRICEIGAVKVRGGEVVHTFHTMVDPERDIPATVTMITGLTSATVRPAPTIESVLPVLDRFMEGTVFVGHNVRFDRAFIDSARLRNGWDRLQIPVIDTCALARRLVREEVPDCRLGTLAERLRLDHRPTHRALDDALATTDLLHVLLERAAGFGVVGLDDLLALPTAGGHPQAHKLRMTDRLPRSPGVYLFRDGGGRVLYVGKASNLRARVRSYFSSDDRRKVGPLLRETAAIDHRVTRSTLEAAVTEIRLIHEHLPRYNRQGTTWSRARYVVLTREAHPRLSVVRRPKPGQPALGPIGTTRQARAVVDAIEAALPVRRCSANPATATRDAPCAPAQLGVSTCPCAGAVDEATSQRIGAAVADALGPDPRLVITRLRERVERLAAHERFEEAADARDRLAAFVAAHERTRRLARLRRGGRVVVTNGTDRIVFDGGHFVTLDDVYAPSLLSEAARVDARDRGAAGDTDRTEGGDTCWAVVDPEEADELLVVTRWFDANTHRLRLESSDAPLWSPLPRLGDVAQAMASASIGSDRANQAIDELFPRHRARTVEVQGTEEQEPEADRMAEAHDDVGVVSGVDEALDLGFVDELGQGA